jgi:hypothetical protein
MPRKRSNKPRTRRDRRRLTSLPKVRVNAKDSTLSGQIIIMVSGLVTPYPGTDPTWRLPAILTATKDRKEFFLKCVVGALMTVREPFLDRAVPSEEQFTKAKETLAEFIARYWGKKVDPKKLEQKPKEWESYSDLKLGYDPEKLPKAPKAKRPPPVEVAAEEIAEEEEPVEEAEEEIEDDDEEMDEGELEKMFEGDFDEYD